MLIHDKDKLRELMVHRRHYLTAANELITDSKTDLAQRATSSDHPDDILRAVSFSYCPLNLCSLFFFSDRRSNKSPRH